MRLGLLVRLFTVSQGRIDAEQSAAAAKPRWERSTVTQSEFEASLDLAAEIGAEVVEITQAGQLAAAELLVANAQLRRELRAMVADRGLSIAALNAAGMPLHPRTGGRSRRLIRRTIELASLLDVRTVLSMSGTGGRRTGGEHGELGQLSLARGVGGRCASDTGKRQWASGVSWPATRPVVGSSAWPWSCTPCIWSTTSPTFERLHQAVGPIISANVDPSHLFWQGMGSRRRRARLG